MSTISDPSKEGSNESHSNDTERSKWFWWRWKRSGDIRLRVAVMKEWSIMYGSGWDTVEFSEWLLLNISATLMWWIGSINPKCGWYGMTMVMWPVNENNPTRLGHGVEVSCSRATCYQKSFFKFSSQLSPVIADQYLFIFVKLEEDNICLFYNLPFGQTHRYVLMSLAIVKLVLVYRQVCRY